MDVRSIQRGTDTIAISGTSKDATITAVDLARTRLVFLGQDGNLDESQETLIRQSLVDSTTVRGDRDDGGGSEARIFSFEVVEEYAR